MVINNLNTVGVPVKPHKTHTPLVVDANAVLTSTITAQSLQSVARWYTQEIKRGRSVQLLQLAQRYSSDIGKFCSATPLKQGLGGIALEAPNHYEMITEVVINVNLLPTFIADIYCLRHSLPSMGAFDNGSRWLA